MKLSRVLLDGDSFDEKLGESSIAKLENSKKWLIRCNNCRILIERRGNRYHTKHDVSIYNTAEQSYRHVVIWNHFLQRFMQRTHCSTEQAWYRICLLLIYGDSRFSKVLNRQYIKGDDKYSFVLAYDMTEDGILVYKTFFIKDNKHCV